MADILDYRDGRPGGAPYGVGRFHDEADGTYSQAVASHLRGWDATDGAWYRLPVDHTTGALKVLAAEGSSGSPWQTSISGTVPVTQSTTPWTVSLSGTVPVTGTFWQTTQPVSIAGTVTVATHDVTQSIASSLNAQVVGNVSAASADAGNPVKAGGVFNATRPTYATGQRGDLQIDSRGHLDVAMYDAAGANRVSVFTPGDAQSTQIGVATFGQGELFNGSNWDRQRGNVDTGALITATAVSTTQTGADLTNYNARGVIVVLDMTNVGTGSVTLEIDGKDTASGKYYALLTGAAVVSNSTNVYTVYPGATASANVAAASPLPRTWRVKVTANNTNVTTYTVGASTIV